MTHGEDHDEKQTEGSAETAESASREALSDQEQVRPDVTLARANPAIEALEEAADPRWADRIRVAGVVGRGAMGAVLRATDMKLQRELALKVAPEPRGKMAPALLARFIEEAQITAQLEHPNVVPVHELGVDPEGRPYFSMKLVRGQSLADILQKRAAGDPQTLAAFGLKRLLDVLLQVCNAIEYAHARGVIHRDLKPANIMVGDFGEVLVMDWGVAKLMHEPGGDAPHGGDGGQAPAPTPTPVASIPGTVPPALAVKSVRSGSEAWATQHGELVGTLAYMSPEQAEGRPVDERSDVYALGIILYEILCNEVPFYDGQPIVMLGRILSQEPRRPSEVNPAAPPALEMLALRLLEKDPARRVTIPQVRAHVQNYIEGIGREYRRESVWTGVSWIAGALGLFAFLVWYLTGESVVTVLALGPPAGLNAVGWFLVVVALGYPLWTIYAAIRQSRVQPDRFRPPGVRQIFVSGYLAHRTFAASVAPLSQLVFIVELLSIAAFRASHGAFRSRHLVQQLANQLQAQWAQALSVTAIFLFAYLFLLSTEARFARKIERYEPLVERKRWESIWPVFLILVLLLTITTTDVLQWFLSRTSPPLVDFLRQQLITPALDPLDLSKTLVFQGTFLLGLVVATLSMSFPFAEVLAAFRMPYESADEAAVSSRSRYFLRSLAVFRVARTSWLYGGAMISSLTAITILSETAQSPLAQKVLQILGPSMIGFAGYSVTKRYVRGYLAFAPAVRRMLEQELERARGEQLRANLRELEAAPLHWRLLGLLVPVVCVLIYSIWTGSGIHRHAIARLVMPVTTEGWLLILPYLLLVPLLLGGDRLQRHLLQRRTPG